MAETTGVTLGRILSMHDDSAHARPQSMARMDSGGATPIATGSLEMGVSFTIVYEILN